ncbi:DUF1223 domain-containing protein [Roseibium algae]|uniref:DUF1223 domain-containing protein n=1 Tax=Roseibium algae TaxID=3123038 RepID=A0ABU8TQG0_9HYPH
MGNIKMGSRSTRCGSLFAAVTCLIAMFSITEGAQAKPVAVAELFTSQGCSSCPPADKLLGEIADQGHVLALSLPVDYWDYLGWKDTLADPANSARQRAYAIHRGDRSVYTPQIVINGLEHVVGSDRDAVFKAIKNANKFTANVALVQNDMGIEATVTGTLPAKAKMATIYFANIKNRQKIEVGRGENAGRTITYVNVVKSLQPIGMWSGAAETFRMPKSELIRAGAEGCIILVQLEDSDGPGTIIGAGLIDTSQKNKISANTN